MTEQGAAGQAAAGRAPLAHGPRRAPWSLRRRLVVTLVALVALVCAVLALVSTLALRGSLVAQLDQRLASASQRAERAPADRPDGARPPADADQSNQTGQSEQDDQTGQGTQPGPPPFLSVAGQAEGTLGARISAGEVLDAGYLDADGEVQPLDTTQTAALATVPEDGEPTTLHLEGLGTFRVVAAETDDGSVLVTGLSTADADQTVQGYLLVEAVVALLALVVAAGLATGLVQRALRPLQRVTATATRVAELPLHSGEVSLAERLDPIDSDPRTEVGRLGTAFNRMIGHVEDALSARQASETKMRRFVADASHELRTPLASIRGYAELVRRSDADNPPATLHALDRIESESVRMTGLVEDLLLLARLDAGRALRYEPVDLAACAIDCVADAHAAGSDHRWHLELPDGDEGPDGADLTVQGDEASLRQVLVNLLANARVHTPAGTAVTVRLSPAARAPALPGSAPGATAGSAPGPGVVLTVTDSGPGIPADLQPTLFERFTRGSSARTRTAGSTGLGLAIATAVVQAHGGTIGVRSRPGETTFTVFLPAQHTVAEPQPDAASQPD